MRAYRASIGMSLVLAFVGCQKNVEKTKVDPHAITGKVYLDGKIVNYGVVAFCQDGDARPLKSPIYPDGTYNIRNPPEGAYRIVITTGQPPRPAAGGSSKDPPPSYVQITIPDKYSSVETTVLKYEVKEGRQTYDIKLESEK